jgi:hypothetical protein
VDPHAVPLERIPERERSRVEHVLADVAAVVPLEASDVKSRLDVYDFLLDEMPFTGGVVRELNQGKWDIFRDPEKPDPKVFYVIDPEGIRLRFELVLKEETRRVYVSKGVFQMGLFGTLTGSTVVVLRTVPRDGTVRTDAVVYVRVENATASSLAKGFRAILEEKVRDKSGYFIRAAKWVAEETARRPEWIHLQVNGSRHVDAAVLEEYRKRFVPP